MVKMEKTKQIEDIYQQIHISARTAIVNMREFLSNVYDDFISNRRLPKNKLYKCNILELKELYYFYCHCFNAAKTGDNRKLKKLCLIELDTILVEDYFDRDLMKALQKFEVIAYT